LASFKGGDPPRGGHDGAFVLSMAAGAGHGAVMFPNFS
jgi:hypothetical protein